MSLNKKFDYPMSKLSDVKLIVSTPTLKNRLTLVERADLLCEITATMGIFTYYNDNYTPKLDKAIDDLKKLDALT